jgi:hypothetical protein
MKRMTTLAGAATTEVLGSTASNAFTVGVVMPGAYPISIAFSQPPLHVGLPIWCCQRLRRA